MERERESDGRERESVCVAAVTKGRINKGRQGKEREGRLTVKGAGAAVDKVDELVRFGSLQDRGREGKECPL